MPQSRCLTPIWPISTPRHPSCSARPYGAGAMGLLAFASSIAAGVCGARGWLSATWLALRRHDGENATCRDIHTLAHAHPPPTLPPSPPPPSLPPFARSLSAMVSPPYPLPFHKPIGRHRARRRAGALPGMQGGCAAGARAGQGSGKDARLQGPLAAAVARR
jgi:hypothetical protein